jgi:hypothetical protein
MKIFAILGSLVTLAWAAPAASQLVKNSPTAKATVTVADKTIEFKGGGCLVSDDSWSLALGDMLKGEHLELNIPSPLRMKATDVVKPTKDGSYTNASLTVIPGAGQNWHAGGRTASNGGTLTVVLKNNRRGGEFSGRTDGSPRQDIKGTFSC